MMEIRHYTETELSVLREMPKRVTNPGARWSEKPRARPVHRQRNLQLVGSEDEQKRFQIYQRQNLEDESDFSCGIIYLPRGPSPLTLARYNGPSHVHGEIDYRPHIHQATESAMIKGRKAESEAIETDRFESLEGALACLLADFVVRGLTAQFDQPRLSV